MITSLNRMQLLHFYPKNRRQLLTLGGWFQSMSFHSLFDAMYNLIHGT